MTKEVQSFNPRGNLWANDEERFGFRMLKQMGWSKGKGLGAKEDGMKEAIKVRPKNDAKGVGYRERTDQWMDHQDDFNKLLSELNGQSGSTSTTPAVAMKSLEAKSKTSRSRVHYHKFTRGKDLSRCSEKDLMCIVGKRKWDDLNSGSDQQDNKYVTSSCSIEDYFSQKMAALKAGEETDEHESTSSSPRKAKRFRMKKVSFNDTLTEVHEIQADDSKKPHDNSDQREINLLGLPQEVHPNKMKINGSRKTFGGGGGDSESHSENEDRLNKSTVLKKEALVEHFDMENDCTITAKVKKPKNRKKADRNNSSLSSSDSDGLALVSRPSKKKKRKTRGTGKRGDPTMEQVSSSEDLRFSPVSCTEKLKNSSGKKKSRKSSKADDKTELDYQR